MSVAGYPIAPDPAVEWTGAKRRYDLIREAVIVLVVVTVLTLTFSAVFSSPDEKPLTVATWASAVPRDFLATALSELDGTSGVATYGPPYTHVAGAGQNIIGSLSIQRAIGVRIAIDPARAFVLGPLSIPATTDLQLHSALAEYQNASESQRQAWTKAYSDALDNSSFVSGQLVLAPASYGPVAPLMSNLLLMARSGALDGALISTSRFYQTNFTKSLLFLADGSYLENMAGRQNLQGSQWGMMNETGNYPGQAWLWLYTFWYQIPPFATSENADAQIWALMGLLSVGFVLLPFIPGVRSIPRFIPIYRLMWRDYYRVAEGRSTRRPTA
ncbi:MAG: hypothetical protein WCH31_00695 [Actinomycetes bacterium]